MGLFKSKKIYYKYNPETLSFERVYLTLKQRIFAFIKHASVGILVGVALFFLFANIFSSPMAQKREQIAANAIRGASFAAQ